MRSLKDLTAITPRGYTLIEASAGTGKTFTITGIYLRLVMEEGLEPEQILVVTFTNAATEELRTKIRTRLDDALEYLDTGKAGDDVLKRVVDNAVSLARGGRDEVRRRLRSATLGMDQAAVFTIHGFCQRVLKEFSFETDALNGTRDVIMDEELHLPACREFVRSRVAHLDDVFLPVILELYNAETLAEELAESIKNLMSLPEPVILPAIDMDAMRRELEIFRKRQEKASGAVSNIEETVDATLPELSREVVNIFCDTLHEKLQKTFRANAKKWINAQLKKELQAFDAILSEPLPQNEKFKTAAGSLIFALSTDAPAPRRLWLFEIFTNRVISQKAAQTCSSRGKMVVDDLSFARYTEALQSWMCKCRERDVADETIQMARDAGKGFLPVLSHAGIRERVDAALRHEAREFARAYMARKKSDLGAISYDDMLKMVHDALQGSRGRKLAGILRQRYRVALIDEFQDTDAIQWQIFSTIYSDSSKSRLFLIGDPKQAIYSFRGADIFTYLEAKKQTDRKHRWELDTNWRSAPKLVQGVNTIFSNMANPFLLQGIDFDPVMARDENDWRLELLSPDNKDWESGMELWLSLPHPDTGPDKEEQEKQQELEDQQGQRQAGESNSPGGDEPDPARLTAAKIAGIIDLGRQGLLVLRGPKGEEKAIGAGDIAVLVRSHNQAAEVRQALYDLGVYSIYYGPSNVFKSTEARELLYVLNAVIAPYSQRAVSTALATTALGYNARELLKVQNDIQAWDGLVDAFMELREIWEKRGIAPMFRRLLHHFDVPKRLLSLTDGQRRLTNFRQLSEMLSEAEKEFPGKSRLLLWLRKQIDDPGFDQDEKKLRLETDENLVKVMTYHMSKGLEFPIVFLPYIGDLGTYRFPENKFFSSKQGRYVLPVSEYGFRFEPQAEGGGFGVHALEPEEERAAREQARAEEVRLAYVALTRARYKMFLGLMGVEREGSVMGDLLLGTMEQGEQFPGISEDSGINAKDPALPLEADTGKMPVVVQDELLSEILLFEEMMEWCSRHKQQGSHHNANNADYDIDAGMDPMEGTDLAVSRHLEKLFENNCGVRLVWQDELKNIIRQEARIRPQRDEDEVINLPVALSGPVTKQTWTRTSFSGITANHGGEYAGIIQHGIELPGPAAGDIAGFPRGAEAGSCIHQIFEDIDFRGEPAAFRSEAERVLEQFNIDTVWADVVSGMVQKVVSAELLPGLALRAVEPIWISKEMGFHLPFDSRFAHNLQGHEIQYEKGVIKGFIDLVFCHEDRFYLLDYKTNWLGTGVEDYNPENMRKAMDQHDYWLQAAIYTAALNTYLETSMQGYDRERNFGGVFYLFVRGISECRSEQNGVLFIPPEELQT